MIIEISQYLSQLELRRDHDYKGYGLSEQRYSNVELSFSIYLYKTQRWFFEVRGVTFNPRRVAVNSEADFPKIFNILLQADYAPVVRLHRLRILNALLEDDVS